MYNDTLVSKSSVYVCPVLGETLGTGLWSWTRNFLRVVPGEGRGLWDGTTKRTETGKSVRVDRLGPPLPESVFVYLDQCPTVAGTVLG